VDAFARLAALLRGPLAEPARADDVMDRLIAANGRSAHAYLARALYRREAELPGPAGQDLDRARELAPDDPDVLAAVADLALSRNDLEAARTTLLHGLDVSPSHEGLATPWPSWPCVPAGAARPSTA